MLAGGLAAVTGAFLYHRGGRYPTLSLEASDLPTAVSSNGVAVSLSDCFQFYASQTSFRAFAPEPKMVFNATKNQRIEFELNNVSKRAILGTSAPNLNEDKDGITRRISFDIQADKDVELHWQVPFKDEFTFASIGDSGGNHELSWCLKRSAELGAEFLLHLGDFNYQDGDYERAIDLFHNAPIPCYITIGNHDFHDSGLLHHQFTDYLGPFNSVFSLGNVRFLNLDTAASVWPRSGGKRGRLVQRLIDEGQEQPQTVAYSHCPLHDPSGITTHDIGSVRERDWVIDSLHKLNAKTLLSGHIHIFDRTEFMGIDNIIVGQGMGHQDLLTANMATSKMALGKVRKDSDIEFEFAPLNMPLELHCHPRMEPVKASLRDGEHADLIKQVDAACS